MLTTPTRITRIAIASSVYAEAEVEDDPWILLVLDPTREEDELEAVELLPEEIEETPLTVLAPS